MRHTLLLAVIVATAGLSLDAHHSYGSFDRTQSVTVTGAVTEVLFANPHVTIWVRTDEGQVFKIEWGSLPQMGRFGVEKTTFGAGDRLVITGSPHRDPAEHYLTLLTEVRRPADGWNWKKP